MFNKQTNFNSINLATNSLKKLRTLRHPDILKFYDGIETDTMIYIATEKVTPLDDHLPSDDSTWLTWGLNSISKSLSFLHSLTNSIHGNLSVNSIFISNSGEWKLGGFEYCTLKSQLNQQLNYIDNAPPELLSGSLDNVGNNPISSIDSYHLALLIFKLFNPTKSLPVNLTSPPNQAMRGLIPMNLFNAFKKLLNPSPKHRLSVEDFLNLGNNSLDTQNGSYFSKNSLIELCKGLEMFSLMNQIERIKFLRFLSTCLNEKIDDNNIIGERKVTIPNSLAIHRILPTLVHSVEFMTAGDSAPSLVPLIVRIGNRLDNENECSKAISKPLLRLWASPDRGTRMALLEDLERYINILHSKIVVNELWPHLITGFNDTAAVIREATVRSIPLVAQKLNDRIMNNELLKQLAKAQLDPEPSIRTNTCILIGKLTPKLSATTRKKILVPACSRALKDSFAPARAAGLRTLLATVDEHDDNDLATKVLPTLCPALLDKEKVVRDQAFEVVEKLIEKLRLIANKMPETAINKDEDNMDYSYSGNANNTILGSNEHINNAANTIASWAFGTSTTSKKLEDSEKTSTMTSLPTPQLQTNSPSPLSFDLQPQQQQYSTSSGGGMKLGTKQKSASSQQLESLIGGIDNNNDEEFDVWDSFDDPLPKPSISNNVNTNAEIHVPTIPPPQTTNTSIQKTIPKIQTNLSNNKQIQSPISSTSITNSSTNTSRQPSLPSLKPIKPTTKSKLGASKLNRSNSGTSDISSNSNSNNNSSTSLNTMVDHNTQNSMSMNNLNNSSHTLDKSQELARKREERANVSIIY